MDAKFPRRDGHVCFRLSEVDFVPQWLKNAKNRPRPSRGYTMSSLSKQVLEAFSAFVATDLVFREELSRMMKGEEWDGCFNRSKSNDADMHGECNTDKVRIWKACFDSLVCCSIDHNPGDSLVCCPVVYRQGMEVMFLKTIGFEICLKKEDDVNFENGKKFGELGVRNLGKWNSRGRLGMCYVILKLKDTRKWRPICPTYYEGGVVASKRVARVVNQLLWDLPSGSNFNMRSTEELVKRISDANKGLLPGEKFVTAAFDIKEMFCNLSHDAVLDAVGWIIDYWLLQRAKGVMLKNRGKEAKVRMRDVQIGWMDVSFDDVMRFVKFDLECTFVMVGGVVLKQRIGIPMGKASSPALACLLTAYSEFTFLNSLGSMRLMTYGARIVDDVSIFVRCKKTDATSRLRVEQVILCFEDCYHENLTLERTDKGRFWEFLGCIVGTEEVTNELVCVATHKNQAMVKGGLLVFQNLQDFCTYSGRQQKLAVISSFLYRAKRYTTFKGAEAVFLLTLKMGLRMRGFPDDYFDTALKTFSDKFEGIWEDCVECFTG
ncbi:hypothetical protein CBR_g54306 [Chara braunii]|uniref:Reverse transcriptase domain-containing protein n=1 Tax=Chara braunii TaxID=69332 RepID=A0A388MC52_CHABU|nr:hypothetical protein CBR_g54306 [Chara braunii]|eukprot:GBG92052.1 hypothetical protein CBR_g54306 [Chara braunii]